MKLFAIVLLSLTAANAAAQTECGKHSVMSTEDDKGRRIELVLDSAKVAKTPRWTPGDGDPPLSLARAVTAALAWAKERYKRYDSVTIREIALVEYSCSSVTGRWYYRVDFMPMMEGSRLLGSGNFAAVLMDATVIAPTVK
jgi:hypothetical protein